jgi:hypothetical protein
MFRDGSFATLTTLSWIPWYTCYLQYKSYTWCSTLSSAECRQCRTSMAAKSTTKKEWRMYERACLVCLSWVVLLKAMATWATLRLLDRPLPLLETLNYRSLHSQSNTRVILILHQIRSRLRQPIAPSMLRPYWTIFCSKSSKFYRLKRSTRFDNSSNNSSHPVNTNIRKPFLDYESSCRREHLYLGQ